ncbi:hypothetical protein FHS83_000795 [Rhizomicrobium palustre]|uniref:DUF4169 domain-containing protein n=1 Tax=Rhizomicrobium palustre TaxID=189966 RepID=A0A846MWW4_9PROT|nr:DUF4169 family protein [Rhizomicrobium palustre]NIK87477.1 hypothetical protein [Rhizomicrobium palustre]
MSNIVNLRQARKQKARAEKEVVADANRLKHGIAKSAHKKAKAVAEQEKKRVDAHKLDGE